MNVLKSIGGVLLGIVIFVAAIIGLILVLTFGSSLVLHIAPFVYWLSGILIIIDVIALLAAITPPARQVSGIIVYVSSYIFGLATWIYGLAVTLALWGIIAVLIGIFLGGVGVVPIGMLAAIFYGRWDLFFTLLIMGILTYATRIVGTLLSESGATENEQIVHSNVIDLESTVTERRKWEDIE